VVCGVVWCGAMLWVCMDVQVKVEHLAKYSPTHIIYRTSHTLNPVPGSSVTARGQVLLPPTDRPSAGGDPPRTRSPCLAVAGSLGSL